MSDESRRCPRCDCPDGAEQCEHCKVCPHADRTVGAMPREKPRASVIEIIAPDYQPTEDGAGSIVVPRQLRINGQPVYTPTGSRIQISDFDLGDELVTVTLTLVARRIVIAADGDLEGGVP